jgi:hypothetical protein
MSGIVSNLVIGLVVLAALGLWAAFIYITAVPDRAGPGTRVWRLRDPWRWLTWKTLRR